MKKVPLEVRDQVHDLIDSTISQLSLNCALFRFHNDVLQVATIDFVHAALTVIPGGFIYKSESIKDAAARLVLEQTGFKNLLIKEVGVFGEAQRSFREEFQALRNAGLTDASIDHISQRFVTIAFYSIIDDREIYTEGTDPFFTPLQWLSVNELEKLHLDHTAIVESAQKKIAQDILAEPILKSFLPNQFTIPNVHRLYELILNRCIDRGNFRQRILKSNILKKVGREEKIQSGRPADVYEFDEKIYLESLCTTQKLGF